MTVSFWRNKQSTHLSLVKWLVVGILREEEHVYKVDEYAGSVFGHGRSVDNPLKDHHENQVAKQTQHEHQLWDQHKEQIPYLAKVPADKQQGEADSGKRAHVKASPHWLRCAHNTHTYTPKK